MGKYIAFLRGINVGGKNKISMAELKQLLEQSGFKDVLTYINSGNVIFSYENKDETELKEEFERLIKDKFQLRIPVSIVSVGDLLAAYEHAPEWWGSNQELKHNAIFIIPPTTVEEIFLEVGEIKPEYEKVDYYGNVVFWSAPIDTFSKTRWSKVVGSTKYNTITVRNANTVKKIIQLAIK